MDSTPTPPRVRRGPGDQQIIFQRPNGQLIDVSLSPKIDPLAEQLRHWPGSQWIFKSDGTYVAKLASNDCIQGTTSASFPMIEVTIT